MNNMHEPASNGTPSLFKGLTAVYRLLIMLVLINTPVVAWGTSSLRFYGNGVNDIDRVKISIDPHVPADVGASDWTLEFWMKANASENTSVNCTAGSGSSWIYGNAIFDRDIFGTGAIGDYGISLFAGGLAFGASSPNGDRGICGSARVADGQWHHVAVTRSYSNGRVSLYVDGQLDAEGSGANGPSGDMSYPNGQTSSYPNDPYLVIGAEKHDVGVGTYPSFSGWIDDVRISNVIRYAAGFSRPTQAFATDANTVALYHFDEGSGDVINDGSGALGGPSNGVRRFGSGSRPAGPEWSSDTPFTASPSPGILQFNSATYSANEGAGIASITVTRTGGNSGSVSVNYVTQNGTALAASDYTAANGTLAWANGDAAAKSFSVPIINDTDVESNETVNLFLSNPSGAMLGSLSTATLTLVDNDSAPPPVGAGGGGGGGGGCAIAEPGGASFDPMLVLLLVLSIFYHQQHKLRLIFTSASVRST
jgi:hypothetical protein